jgi:hypothetical protein
MFLLEDGRLVGDSEQHLVMLGWTDADGYDTQLTQAWCEQNGALRLCFGPFQVKRDGTRGDFWCLYIEIGKILPNEAQWDTISKLFLLHGHRDTVLTWDIRLPGADTWSREEERSLGDLKRLLLKR